ncbi:MAG: FAD-binding protein [Coriobacteriales bacterium]|nr:FAD-binding protein [Coriobacteriales bacterium]
MEMTRRNFVAAAAGTAAVAGLSVPFANAANVAYETDGPGETEPIPPVDEPAAYDYEADFVVIGSGGGMSGALRALDLGASAIVIEKMPVVGGETQEACVFAFVSGTRCQTEAGLPDVTETLREKFYASAPFGAKQRPFIDNVMAGSKQLVEWLEGLGLPFEPGYCVGGEAVYAVCPEGSAVNKMNLESMTYLTKFLASKIEEKGGQFLLSTEAEALIMADGAVKGVMCTAEDDSTIYVKANKGVLIATNGIQANRAMLAKYAPDALRCKVNVAGGFTDGKGIRMGFGAGAEFGGYDQFGVFDGGLDSMPWESLLYAPVIQVCRQPWLGIDVHGDRYSYGTTGLSGFTAQGKLLKGLPGNHGYVIFDDDWYERSLGFDQQMCRMPLDPAVFGDELYRVPEIYWDYKGGVETAMEEGLIESADTIEELAEKLGLDPEVLVKAVDNYNAIVEAGEDPDGPYAEHPEYLFPIVKAPFHGAKQGGMLYATSAGLAINENIQVLDKMGKPIPGLYCGGAAAARDIQVCGSCCFSNTSAFLAATHALS